MIQLKDAQTLLDQIFYYMNELVSEKDFQKTILLLTELGRVLANSERTSFWYWDKDKKEYWTMAATETGKIVVPQSTGIVGAAIDGKEAILINSPYEDARFNPEVDKKTGYKTRSILCIPVTDSKGNVIGAYQAINKMDCESGFDSADMKRLSLAAVYCGKTLESHILSLESQTDKLTGVRNRKGFYEYYHEHRTSGLIMCDIDFFKKVNDQYGHNAGDACLKQVAEKLVRACKDRGEVFRWGGEEFIILLPDADLTSTVSMAQNMREIIAGKACEFENRSIPITMSFGTTLTEGTDLPDIVIQKADQYLYAAKNTGRNKVVSEISGGIR